MSEINQTPETNAASEPWFCSNCGTQNAETSACCYNCGTPKWGTEPQPAAQPDVQFTARPTVQPEAQPVYAQPSVQEMPQPSFDTAMSSPAPVPPAPQMYQQPAPVPPAPQMYQQPAPVPPMPQMYQQPAPVPPAPQMYQQPVPPMPQMFQQPAGGTWKCLGCGMDNYMDSWYCMSCGRPRPTSEDLARKAEEEKAAAEALKAAEEQEAAQRAAAGIIYQIDGARGKMLTVYENKCVIATRMMSGGGMISSADSFKTIYFSDCIGVQSKTYDMYTRFFQFETASGMMMPMMGVDLSNDNVFPFDSYTAHIDDAYQYISDRIEQLKGAKHAPAQPSASSADEIKKFKELLDLGAITQEEFDAKKKQLLGI